MFRDVLETLVVGATVLGALGVIVKFYNQLWIAVPAAVLICAAGMFAAWKWLRA